MRLPIRYYGDPILRKRAEPIQEITEEIRQLVKDMIDTIDLGNGIGLAAPQVGLSIRLFILRNYIISEDGRWSVSEPKVFINPKISSPSQEMVVEDEGCLSLPGIRENVIRPFRITIEATDLDENLFTEEVEGINARVRMHENDHINGVLFIDRLDTRTRNKIDADLRAIKKKYSSNK